MGSQSSRRKSGSRIPRDLAEQLLRSGLVISSPSAAQAEAARQLQSLGLITAQVKEFVRCANPRDRDFPPKNRRCTGRIVLAEDHTDSGAELSCPVCDRRVFPDHFQKQRFTELRSSVLPEGVTAYCRGLLEDVDASVASIATGVFRLQVAGIEVYICLIDYLTDAMFWSQAWAAMHPACFIAVNPRHIRGAEATWLAKTSLAELICGERELSEILAEAAQRGRPQNVPHASVALFGKGPAHTIVEPERPRPAARRFVVEVGPAVVRIDGQVVISAASTTSYRIFRMLWQWHLSEMHSAKAPQQFRAWNIEKIAEEITAQTKHRDPDLGNIRRALNRIQKDCAETLRRELGTPIDHNDIVQSVDGGFRINPFSVAVLPFQPDLS